MPVHKLNDAFVSINTVDLSDHVKTVRVEYGVEALDDTAMGMTTKSSLGGLFTWSLAVDFEQDYSSAKVDATLAPLVGTKVPFVIRPTSPAASATNPSYSGTGLLTSYSPVSGSVGELHMTTAQFASSSTLTRGTS